MEKHKTMPNKACRRGTGLGERKTAFRKERIIDNIVEMMNERKKYKNATDQQEMEKYRSLRNVINRKCRKSKKVFLDSICKEVSV